MASMAGHIDYWVVVDTGSDDDTPQRIQAFFGNRGIPGELHHRPWRNFADNRNDALRLAEGKADYLLLADADMTLSVNDPEWKAQLQGDAYLIRQRMPNLDQFLPRLINARLTGAKRWRYRCATHEYLDSEAPGANPTDTFHGIDLIDLDDGGCKRDKFQRDAQLLHTQLQALEHVAATPDANLDSEQTSLKRDLPVLLPRTLFYLAQSHDNGNLDLDQAIQYYQRRIQLGGWQEEVAYSWLRLGICLERMHKPWPESLQAYLQSWQAAPHRVEAILQAVRHYNQQKQWHIARLLGAQAAHITQPPSQGLFVDIAAHQWIMRDEYALACYWSGDSAEAGRIWTELLTQNLVPENQKERVRHNLTYTQQAHVS